MKILFIDPPGDRSGYPNIGLGYLCGTLIKAGHIVKVLAMNTPDNLSRDDKILNCTKKLKDTVQEFSPELIGVSIHSQTYFTSLKIIDCVEGIPVVAGGPHVCLERENIFRDSSHIKYAVVGEGEKTLLEIVECLGSKQALSGIKGLIYMEGNEIKTNPLREIDMDLDSITFPDYSIFEIGQMREYPIITSRGCPYTCSFCFKINEHKKWRGRSADNVIAEIKFAKTKYKGITSFGIWDSLFNQVPEHAKEICHKLITESIDLPWICYHIRADKLDEELVSLMKESKCVRVDMGVESTIPEVFKSAKKGESLEDIKKAVDLVHKYGMQVNGSLIIGLPGDTYKRTLESFEKAKSMGFDNIWVMHLVPYPMTPVYEWIKTHGRFLGDYRTARYSHELTENDICFETPEFRRKERVKASYILVHIKRRFYPKNRNKFRILLDVLRYDIGHLLWHIYDLFFAWLFPGRKK